jgi:hypothetical protein
MRNMSFALTTDQVKAETKDVTRRLGWKNLKPGELFCAVKKGMGLKPGEKIERLKILRAVDVRQEPLRRMLEDLNYGFDECRREGFPPPHPKHDPVQFVTFFCETHQGCTPDTVITRIAFQYVYTVWDGEGAKEVPADVAKCPYCETKLVVQVSAWDEVMPGFGVAVSIDMNCETEPDIESDEWEEWLREHSEMPYEYQLPVDMKVMKWLNSKYRFPMG